MTDQILIIDDFQLDHTIKEILLDYIEDIRVMEMSCTDPILSELIPGNIQVCILHISNKSDLRILREIKESSHVMDIPVIVCNRLFDLDIMQEAFFLGAYDCFTRPKKGDVDGTIFAMKVKQAIEFRKNYAKIAYLSYHDPLTNLYNKRFFEEELRRLNTTRQLPISIIVGDVNGLKITNDVFGHHIGDQVLIEVSKIIKSSCRKEDIIARWGGDEFFILLPKTPTQLAKDICSRIQSLCLTSKFDKIPLSIALGYYTKEQGEEDIFYIVQKAEEKMYQQKLTMSRFCHQQLLSSIKKSVLNKSPSLLGSMNGSTDLLSTLNSKLQLTSEEFEILHLMKSFLDIGYITLDERILNKAEELDEEEWKLIKQHTDIGYRIAKASPQLSNIADYILYHHERWDGKGYPFGLKGEEIPKLSRIVYIINAYEAMIHERPYRNALKPEEAIIELQRGSGTQFDPKLVDVFIEALTTAVRA